MDPEQNKSVSEIGADPNLTAPVYVETPPLEPIPPQSDHRRRRLLYSALLVLIFAAAAAGAYAWTTSPARVIAKAERKFAEAKTMEYEAELKFSGAEMATMFNSFTVNLSGVADLNEANARSSTNLRFTMDGGVEEGTMSVNAEFRSIDKTMYFKIGKIPILEMFLGDVAGKWYKFNLEELSDALGSEELKELTENEAEYNEKVKKVQAVYEKYKVIKISKKLDSEKIDGENTFHYEWYLDKVEFEKFLTEAYQIMGEELPEKEDVLKEIENKEVKGELWIGKQSYYLHKVTMSLPDVQMQLSFKNYNKTATVEVPEKAESIEGLLNGALGGTGFEQEMPILPQEELVQ